MTDDEHQEIVSGAYAGTLLIGIDREVAWRVLMKVPLSEIGKTTGERPYVEKFVVKSLFAVSWLALAASLPLAYFAFGWWAAALIPASIAVFILSLSVAWHGQSRLCSLTLLLGATVGAAILGFPPNQYISWYAVTFATSLWAGRAVFVTGATLLRAFVIRNKRAFELINPTVSRAR